MQKSSQIEFCELRASFINFMEIKPMKAIVVETARGSGFPVITFWEVKMFTSCDGLSNESALNYPLGNF